MGEQLTLYTMAKSKPTPPDDAEAVITPEQQIAAMLKTGKEDHYNNEPTISYKVPPSSLKLMAAMNGGISPGAHRACGVTTGGKTSCLLDLMFNFFKETTPDAKKRRGVFVKSEGRLSDEVKVRSGVTFTTDAAEWKDGTCFVLESNVYEFVFGFLGDLIRNNPTDTRYFIIIDSMDMMAKRDDLKKGLEEAGQVAGGALLTSVFLKKTSVALAKRGHVMWFISQIRDTIKINQYEKTNPRQASASGGHALEHAGDWVLEFLPRTSQEHLIKEDPKNYKSKTLGHWCRVKIVKSNNEKYGDIVEYPIRYNCTGGKSVWREYEVADMLQFYKRIETKGSWLRFDDRIKADIKENTGVEVPDKGVQGIDNLYALLESEPKVTTYLFDLFYRMDPNVQ